MNYIKLILLGFVLIFWIEATAQKLTSNQVMVLTLRHLPGSTTDTNLVFSENYVNGISIWNEFNSFMKFEWNPHLTNSDLKLDTLYSRLAKSKFYLENAHNINKKDTNTIIGLIGVSRSLGDTISFKKYLDKFILAK